MPAPPGATSKTPKWGSGRFSDKMVWPRGSGRRTTIVADLGTLAALEPVSQGCVHSKMQLLHCLSRPLGQRDVRESEVLVRPGLSREAGLACRRASIACYYFRFGGGLPLVVDSTLREAR